MCSSANNVIVVGNGIAALAAITSLCQSNFNKNNSILCLSDTPYQQNSSSAAYAIIGGNGCFLAKNPRSRFRMLMQAATRQYANWLKNTVPHVPLKNLYECHVYNLMQPASFAQLQSKKKMLCEEGNRGEDHNKLLLPTPLLNGISHVFKTNNNHSPTSVKLGGLTFNDSFYINAAKLIKALRQKAIEDGVKFINDCTVKSYTKHFDKIILHTLNSKTNNSQKSPLKKDLTTKNIIFAAGHKNSTIATKSGYRLKTYSNWNHWVGFCNKNLPHNVLKILTSLKENTLVQFQEHSLLFIKDAGKEEITLQLATKQIKKFWQGDCLYKEKLLQSSKTNNSAEMKSPYFIELQTLWQTIFNTPMPNPNFYGSGFRNRCKDWMPHIGLLPDFFSAEENTAHSYGKPISQIYTYQIYDKNAKAILLANFYKSGITFAPIIAQICPTLLTDTNNQKLTTTNNAEIAHFIKLLSPARNGLIQPYSPSHTASASSAHNSWLHYPFKTPT